MPWFLPAASPLGAAFRARNNRYGVMGSAVRRIMARASWSNMAVAELRDLNRHRTGFRFSPLTPKGFYLPPGVTHPRLDELRAANGRSSASSRPCAGHGATYVYGLLLGTQVAFEHSTHLDKLIYEIELRTGLGAHFRYAEHLTAVHRKAYRDHAGSCPAYHRRDR